MAIVILEFDLAKKALSVHGMNATGEPVIGTSGLCIGFGLRFPNAVLAGLSSAGGDG